MPVVIGWRERVEFLDWGIRSARAKIDTGARTSAIDALVNEIQQGKDGVATVVLTVGDRGCVGKTRIVHAPLIGTRRVRSTNGEVVERHIIETTIRLGPVTKKIQLSIANRCRMLVPILLGRRALAGDFWVDVSRKYILSA